MADSANGAELLSRLHAQLKPVALAALAAIEEACLDDGARLYLVCGTLRDLVLERTPLDFDLAIEGGDAPSIAQRVGEQVGARIVVHRRFGTAKLSSRDFQFDIAGTRRETYPHPGSLPQVEPATLAQDLARRDFAINAFALQLAPEPGDVIDPFRGIEDIRSGLIRVLHERSFQDDATRMLRGVRYATRFGFKLQRDTEALLRHELPYLKRISGPRLRRELTLQFQEPGAVAGVQLAQRLGILETIHPALGLREDVATRWTEALSGHHEAPLDETGFCVLADVRDEGTAASLTKWLHLTGRVEHALHDLVRLRELSDKLSAASASPAAAVELLEHHVPSAVWALSILDGGPAGTACREYLAHWRHTRPLLSGDDLLALGVEPGVAVGEMLKQLRRAQLQVNGMTRDQEIELVRAALPGGGATHAD
jgi:tRNA nucleotidyltransferase (CCA-adding enzyme)